MNIYYTNLELLDEKLETIQNIPAFLLENILTLFSGKCNSVCITQTQTNVELIRKKNTMQDHEIILSFILDFCRYFSL